MKNLSLKLCLLLICMGIAVLTLCLLYGCKVSSYSYHDSSGKLVHKITCLGIDNEWQGFDQAASDLCGTSGYTIVSEFVEEFNSDTLLKKTFCITCNEE